MTERLLTFLARNEVWTLVAALVGFLTLTWVIRGAPLGQSTRDEPDDAPGPGYRDRVVVAAVVGLLLVGGGAIVATNAGIPWSLPLFALGFGLVVAVLQVNRRYRHVSPTLRRVLDFSNTALTASLLAGILVISNVVAFKYGGRSIDLTRDRAFSLSSLTVNQIQTLDRPLSFVVYFGNSERSTRQLDRVRQLLDLYKAARPEKVSVDYLNPYTESGEFEALAKRVPDVAATSGGDGIVLTYGEGDAAPHVVIGTRDLFEAANVPTEARADRFTSSFRGEDIVTSALIRLREGKRSRVAFTTGHQEPSTADFNPGQPGAGLWRARLGSFGTDVIELNLLRDEIPADVSLLVINGPRQPFQAGEVERIKQLIARDGRLIVLLDNRGPTGLDDLLRTYNVELGQGLVVDPAYNYRGQGQMVYVLIPPGGNHPVTESLKGRAVLLQSIAPIAILGPSRAGNADPKKVANPGVLVAPILRTSPGSWAESDPGVRPFVKDPGRDLPGPITAGVAVSIRPALEAEKPTPRMVVLSTGHVADNPFLEIEPTNLDLLMNAVSWLKGRPELLGIAPKMHETLMFAADPGLQLRLVTVPTLLAVVAILGLGATTYLARRD